MKKTAIATLFLVLSLLLAPLAGAAQREAFPGAEGYGRMTTGGRGGAVYHVTTLEDNDQPGSFRYACNQKGTRTIVFDVSGTIYLTSELRLREGNVTIAGQTAPGDGICIADYPFSISASNVIIRFVRFRLGNRQVAYHEGDGLGGMDQRDIIIDHCSVSWSIDECLSVYGSTDITVQWCIASHSLQNSGHSKGAHGYGGNWGGRRASYHHNLLANHSSRTPRLGPRPGTQEEEQMDYRNNVVYNYGSNGCYGGEGMNVNMVNNYYKPGKTSNSRKSRIAGLGIRTLDYCFDKNTTIANYNRALGTNVTTASVRRINGAAANGYNQLTIGGKTYTIDMETNTIDHEGTKIEVAWNGWKPMLHKWGTLYVDGNYNPLDAAVTADNWTTGIYSQISASSNDNMWNDQIKQDIKLDTPIEYVYTTTHSAQDAYERVLAYAGTSHRRDAYDDIVTADVRSGNASFTSTGIIDSQNQVKYADGTTGWPALKSETAPVDTDGDGMPDAWETANGLDPANAADGRKRASNGYTNLENYINSLVENIIAAQNEGGKMLTGNLESTDPGVELPEYKDDGLTEYILAPSTYLSSEGSTWKFDDGFSIDNNLNRAYTAGEQDCMRFNTAVVHTVNIPDGMSVAKVELFGYSSISTSDSWFTEFNGADGSQYIFPRKDGSTIKTASHTIEFTDPVSGSFSFKVGGTTMFMNLRLSASSDSGISDIVVSDGADSTDTRIFNMMGIEVKAPLTPGIYIQGGRKFIVR